MDGGAVDRDSSRVELAVDGAIKVVDRRDSFFIVNAEDNGAVAAYDELLTGLVEREGALGVGDDFRCTCRADDSNCTAAHVGDFANAVRVGVANNAVDIIALNGDVIAVDCNAVEFAGEGCVFVDVADSRDNIAVFNREIESAVGVAVDGEDLRIFVVAAELILAVCASSNNQVGIARAENSIARKNANESLIDRTVDNIGARLTVGCADNLDKCARVAVDRHIVDVATNATSYAADADNMSFTVE